MFRRKAAIIFAAVTVTVLSIAVSGQSENGEGVRWIPFEINRSTVTAGTAYIEITDTQKSFTGNTGCNGMSGTVAMGLKSIKFGSFVMTRRACKMVEGSVAQGTFVQALTDSTRFDQKGSFLTLYDRRGRAVLKFQAQEKADDNATLPADLEGQKWLLETKGVCGDGAVGERAFLTFDGEKKSAGGNTGCNVFGSSFTSDGESLSITNIVSTMRACEEGDKMQVEREFLDGLTNSTRYEIKGGHLFLYAGEKLVLTLRQESK